VSKCGHMWSYVRICAVCLTVGRCVLDDVYVAVVARICGMCARICGMCARICGMCARICGLAARIWWSESGSGGLAARIWWSESGSGGLAARIWWSGSGSGGLGQDLVVWQLGSWIWVRSWRFPRISPISQDFTDFTDFRDFRRFHRFPRISPISQVWHPNPVCPGPEFIDRFLRHFTFQMTGQERDRFRGVSVRLPTKQSFFFEISRITGFPKSRGGLFRESAYIWGFF